MPYFLRLDSAYMLIIYYLLTPQQFAHAHFGMYYLNYLCHQLSECHAPFIHLQLHLILWNFLETQYLYSKREKSSLSCLPKLQTKNFYEDLFSMYHFMDTVSQCQDESTRTTIRADGNYSVASDQSDFIMQRCCGKFRF